MIDSVYEIRFYYKISFKIKLIKSECFFENKIRKLNL